MITVTENYMAALKAGNREIVLGFFQSRMGRRVYALQTPTTDQMGSTHGILTYNGAAQVGDGSIFGSQSVILDWGAYAVSFGGLRETLSPNGTDLLVSLSGGELTETSAVLNNTTGHFSDVLADESFLNQTYMIRQGFLGLGYQDFLTLFSGVIVEETLTETECLVRAQVV
jgi:hypothetical protein